MRGEELVGEDLWDEVDRDVLLTLHDHDAGVGQSGGHGVDTGLQEGQPRASPR
jgi:hypothetical protein